MCFTITLIGTVLQSIPVLAIAAIAAFFAMFPPNHPFDYLYNLTVGRLMNRPKLPPRTNQGRFACAIATVWLAGTIHFFATGRVTAGIAMGVALLIPAGLVGFFDVCLPSLRLGLLDASVELLGQFPRIDLRADRDDLRERRTRAPRVQFRDFGATPHDL